MSEMTGAVKVFKEMGFTECMYLVNPNWDYLYLLILLPCVVLFLMICRKSSDLCLLNTVLSFFCGLIPTLVFFYLYVRYIYVSFSSFQDRFDSLPIELGSCLLNFALTQIVTVITILVGIYFKLKEKKSV